MYKMIFSTWRLAGNRFLPVIILLGLLVMSGCSLNQAVSLPPITSAATGQHQVGKFVWFDLLTEDVQKAQRFYTELFGWRFAAVAGTPDYMVIYSDDKPIGGIVPYANKDPNALESIWLAFLSVEDVDRAVSDVKARNGQLLDGPLDVRGRGRMAVIRDPAGAELGLIRAEGGDPVSEGVTAGEWLWVDLFTRDARKASEFYGALAGYVAETVKTDEDHSYNLLRRGGLPYAGVVELPWEVVEPNWLPYIKVDDLEATIFLAEKLGGVLILRSGDVAVIADPNGGAFGIQMIGGKPS